MPKKVDPLEKVLEDLVTQTQIAVLDNAIEHCTKIEEMGGGVKECIEFFKGLKSTLTSA